MQLRKTIYSYAHKTAAEQPTFAPKISNKTKKIAEGKRSKIVGDDK